MEECNNKILVSIVSPVYNANNFLDVFLKSLIKQKYFNIEIICIDDGSTDDSLKILEVYAKKDLRIKVLTQKNQGAAAARNLGLSVAKGKYVIFLDSDDYFEPNLIEASVKQAEKFNADMVIFKAEAFDDITGKTSPLNDRISSLKEYQNKTFCYKDMPEDILNSFLIAPWNKLYRKIFLDKYGFQFQNVKRTNDLLFTSQTLVMAEKIILLDKVLVHYRTGQTKNLQSGNSKTPLDFYKALYELKRYLDEKNLYEEVCKSYIKMVLDVIFYNLNSINSNEQIKELMQFFKQKGFKNLGVTDYEKLYKISLLGYLQYYFVMNAGIFNNVKLIRYLYKLFKVQQYLQISGIKGLMEKIKQNLIARRRKRKCK